MNTTFDPSTQSPHPTPPVRLRRDVHGTFGGVASGLGRYFGIDVTLIRVGFAVASVFAGLGILTYIALWLGIPDDLDRRPARLAFTQNVAKLFIAGVFAVFALQVVVGGAGFSSGLLLPALLIGGGIYLLNQRDDADLSIGGQHPKAEAPYDSTGTVQPPPPGSVAGVYGSVTSPATGFGPAHAAPAEEGVIDDRDPLLVEAEQLMNGDMHERSATNEPAHWAMTKTEAVQVEAPRRRPRITTFTLGAAGLISALVFVSSMGQVPILVYPFIFLGMAVVGFIASLFFRRPAWALIVIAFFSFCLGMGAIFATVALDDGVGEVNIEFGSTELPTFQAEGFNIAVPEPPFGPGEVETFSHGVGEFNLDFDALEITEPQIKNVELNVGQMSIDLPDAIRTRVVFIEDSNVHFSDGSVEDFNEGDVLVVNEDLGGPELTLNLKLQVGEIHLDIAGDEFNQE